VLEFLPLDDAVADALRGRGRSVEGAVLTAVLAYEYGIPAAASAVAPDVRAVGSAYCRALAWTQTVTAGLG
jgi:hypothetical protein